MTFTANHDRTLSSREIRKHRADRSARLACALAITSLTWLTSSCTTKNQGAGTSAKNPAVVASPVIVDPSFTSTGASRPAPELLSPPTGDYLLGPEDKLEIEIIGESDTRTETFVTPDGRVYFDLLDGVVAEGKSTGDLKAQLEQDLTQYYQNPQVSVNLVEATSKQFTILGRVNSPGNYSLDAPLQVLDAITIAGGLFASRFTGTTEELADLAHSFVIRDGKRLPVDFQALIREGDLSQNIYLQAEDFIYLPSVLTNEVYVLGAVTEPRPVGFMNELTLTGALGKGLGIQRHAHLDRVAIIRGSLTNPSLAIVDATAILNGTAPNVRLQPGDIVYVPGEGTISANQIGRNAVDTFVRVISANEGARAGAGSDAAGVGVNISLGSQN